MAPFKSFTLLVLLCCFILSFVSHGIAYLLPQSRFLQRNIPHNEDIRIYNPRTRGRADYSTGFNPNMYFSNYFGNSHIYGGDAVADDNERCGMAYITMRDGAVTYSGSGVLISNYFVLTAAHNFDFGTTQADVTVYLGGNEGEENGAVPFENIWRLSGYNNNNARGGNDMAIIKLSNYQPSRCLTHWQSQEWINPSDGDVVTARGYGRTVGTRDPPATGEGTLRQASLRIAVNGDTVRGLAVCEAQSEVSQYVCAVSPGYPGRIDAGTCVSDSGGPLIKDTGTLKWVVGVNSYSDTRCDRAGNVDMFTRVWPHRNTIHGIVYNGNTAGWTVLP